THRSVSLMKVPGRLSPLLVGQPQGGVIALKRPYGITGGHIDNVDAVLFRGDSGQFLRGDEGAQGTVVSKQRIRKQLDQSRTVALESAVFRGRVVYGDEGSCGTVIHESGIDGLGLLPLSSGLSGTPEENGGSNDQSGP